MITGGVNQSYLRSYNQRSVLGAVYERGPVSKACLSRLLGISKPAMADNVSRLISAGLLRETGETPSPARGGRRPVLLNINKNFRYIVIIDFSYLSSRFDLYNLCGEPVSSFSVKQTPSQEFDRWISMCLNAVETLLHAQNLDGGDIAAIGISSPGVISPYLNEIIIESVFGEFNPRILRQRLIEKYDCPVYIKNSTNAAALGEYTRGAGRGSACLLYISCGQGLGAGIVFEGRIYQGSRMAAGEIANFITPETAGSGESLEKRICIGGLIGNFLGMEANRVKLSQLPPGQEGRNEAVFEEIVALWRGGDPFLAAAVKDIALQLGCLVSNMVMVLNCDRVVFGGEYHVFAGEILPRIREMIETHCIVGAGIEVSQLKERASSAGMAALCRDACFDQICESRNTEIEGI
ncbi:MAG: ROK family transcriptional regulator [Spirochaetaceae bacterium]|jgi:predicted NBD/HSP70 family sugar kinase|nr:ROK family transcriptional regulator [Spirochaetaceae bacterium]